jgi:hypothetical protein
LLQQIATLRNVAYVSIVIEDNADSSCENDQVITSFFINFQGVANRSTRKLGLFIFFITEDYLCEIVIESLLSLLDVGSTVKLTTAWLPI